MNVKVKLKNMELWVSDFNDDDELDYEKNAQILQLQFIMDMSYVQESFGVNLHCIQKELDHQQQNDDGKDNQTHTQVINITSEATTQLNIDQLSIQQLLVDQWLDVQNVVWRLFDQKQNPESDDNVMSINDRMSETLRSVSSNYQNQKEESSTSSNPFQKSEESELLETKYYQCKILNPTCISIMHQTRQEY